MEMVALDKMCVQVVMTVDVGSMMFKVVAAIMACVNVRGQWGE